MAKKLATTKDLTSSIQKKSAAGKKRATKPIDKKNFVPLKSGGDGQEEKYTGKFDLTADGVHTIPPGKQPRSRDGKDEGLYGQATVYLAIDEKRHLKELAEKYNTSVSAIVRTLIVNAK